MRMRWVVVLAAAVLLVGGPAAAQEAQEEGVRVFLDCNAFGCHDFDFFRREIPVVDWVRDREVADVHILITARTTGGGGRSFELSFIGLAEHEGTEMELTWASSGDAVEDEVRRGVAEQIKIGLVPYVAGTPAAERLSVSFGPVMAPGAPGMMPPGMPGGGGTSAEDDPWDFWVFRVSLNGSASGESTSSFSRYSSNISASRTTEDWKFRTTVYLSNRVQEFELTDTTIRAVQQDRRVTSLLVRSLTDHWSVGIRGNAGSSTSLNQDLTLGLRPGVEYSIFPYSESSRRALTLQYLIGPTYYDYAERTIFEQLEETRWQESLTAGLTLVQPWGQWFTSVTGSHYLHDVSKYNVTIFGSMRVRLFKGFSVNMFGSYSWIEDQLYPSAGGVTDEEALLQLRQRFTTFRYSTSFGISYQFGSIFNNVVNPRFGSDGGGGMIIMG